jgi:hypothetical protein
MADIYRLKFYRINKVMLLYKKISIENFDIIQDQLLSFLIKHFDGVEREILSGVPKDDILAAVPMLNDFFVKNNLQPNMFAVFVRAPWVQAPIHVDGDSEEKERYLAINLPIANCAGTYQNYYTIPTAELEFIEDRGNRYKAYTKEPRPEIFDRVEIVEPHLLRVDMPHDVDNEQDAYRVMLSIRFDPQPLHLWPEPMVLWN